MTKTTPSSRLLSIDILRGITICGMILVNNPGSWGSIYTPLGHVEWNGLTPTDLVFPFFMFIMGVSMYFSLRSYQFTLTKPSAWKIAKRTILIFLVGFGLNWFGLFCRKFFAGADVEIGERVIQAVWNFDSIRILGVMQRLAIAYGIGSLIACCVKEKFIPWFAGALILLYGIALSLFNGFEASTSNLIYTIDNLLIGEAHLYHDSSLAGLALDPEGLFSSIGSIAHVLIGFTVGSVLIKIKDNHLRIEKIFIIGTILLFAGLLLHYGWPINKKIWSPSFILVTTGFASQLLALLIWLIDIQGIKKWTPFFESFGVNPLYIYVQAGILASLIGNIRTCIPTEQGFLTLKSYLYSYLFEPLLGSYAGSLLYAISFVLINWTIGYILYKRKIYIKL